MAVSDDIRIAMWREVLGLCRVAPGEELVILTGEASLPQNLDAAWRAALGLGARCLRLDLPPPAASFGRERTAHLGTTPLTGQCLAVDTLKRADMVIDLLGLLHSPEQNEILAAGTRMLMVVEPPEILAGLVPTPEDKRRVMAAEARLRKAREMRVTSPAGTDLVMALGRFAPLAEYGYVDTPGRWDHWPSGFISTWPDEGSARGRVVLDAGDILLPMKRYVEAPVALEIEGGMIRRISGGFDATYLRRHLESYGDPDAFAVAHVGWGLQPRARWTALGQRDKAASLAMDARAYEGNFLFSTGPNAEAGGSNHSPCHVDMPMAGCSVSLDGEAVTRDGVVLA